MDTKHRYGMVMIILLLHSSGMTAYVKIQLDRSCSDLEQILPVMQKPFPALTSLAIGCSDYGYRHAILVFPKAFLGGSTQHLRSCDLWAVEFLGIWELLLPANQVESPQLLDLFHPLTGLKDLHIAEDL